MQSDPIPKTLTAFLAISDPKQQQEYLIELINKANLNLQLLIDEIDGGILDKVESNTNKENLQYWLELAITLLSVQECFEYASRKAGSILHKFIQKLGEQNNGQKYKKVVKVISKHSSLQKSIVLHTFYVKHCISGINQIQYPKLVATFIRLSSAIVQLFLQIKNQPAKGSEDRIQDDKVILANCQKWLRDNIQEFFKKLAEPKQPITRKTVLLAIGDVIGALMEINRENIINKFITEQIMQKILFEYCRQHYTWNQVHELYQESLIYKQFNNPIKKIEIPEEYSQKNIKVVGLNTQAFAYLMINFYKLGLVEIKTINSLLNIFGIIVAELASRPYQIKIQALFTFQKLAEIAKPIQILNGFQGRYPIQLIFFYLYHYQHEKYETIRSNFQFEKTETEINSLLVLKDLHIENLSREKDKYILSVVHKMKEVNDRLYILLRKFNFKDQNTSNQTLLLEICEKLMEKNKKLSSQIAREWKKQHHEEKLAQKFQKLTA